ncbi:MAG: arylsulfatase [Tannerella sp.]|jgi:arylsulfatase|nr:arylsulfatase [Tannerella sp.]
MRKINYSAALKGTIGLAALANIPFAGNAQVINTSDFKGVVNKTYETSKESWPDRTNPAAGKPNVVWILLDDVGFGASSAFGGLIRTPNFDQLANAGLRYTNFHTCAISAPTRAALLTGRNHHRVHEGGFSHKLMSAGFPGYDGYVPAEAGTIAETLRDYGYNTFAVGKYGITRDEDATDAGPFDRWPTGKGFEKFFGFLGSQTDQYKPSLVEDNQFITPDGRHLSEQITDKAIDYIQRQKKAAPDKPFFLYYAPAAVHAPHQVAKKWRDEYKGVFDEGWDVYREKVFAQQKKLGIIPADAVLPDREEHITAWNDLSPDAKKVYARFFETYAAYLTYTDYEVGRVIQTLKDLNQLDNTVIFVLIGDNGASKEGDFSGTLKRDELAAQRASILKSIPITEEDLVRKNLEQIDLIGEPEGTGVNYPLGWAQAANTPFRFWKQDANSEGGTHNPLIVHYPKGITEKGGIRNQYGHVIDLFPTTIDLLGLPAPKVIRGVEQIPLQGTSLAYSFNDQAAPSKHTVQYYYIFGNGSIYQDGWKASFTHHPDFLDISLLRSGKRSLPELLALVQQEPVWELYNLNEDFNERINLAASNPQKLAELKALFERQAEENNVYPLIHWGDIYGKQLQSGGLNQKEVDKVIK